MTLFWRAQAQDFCLWLKPGAWRLRSGGLFAETTDLWIEVIN
jgi:hypothetical protein